MTDALRQYLISIVSASIICAMAVTLAGKKQTFSVLTKLLAGIFLSITVISPWTRFCWDSVVTYWDSVDTAAYDVAASAEAMANDAKCDIIKEQIQAYILDKANTLGLSIDVQVELGVSLEPVSVMLTGNVSPYARNQLQQYIAEELGIPKEMQSWM